MPDMLEGMSLNTLLRGIHVGLLAQKKLIDLGVFEEFAGECEEIGICITGRDTMKEELVGLLKKLSS